MTVQAPCFCCFHITEPAKELPELKFGDKILLKDPLWEHEREAVYAGFGESFSYRHKHLVLVKGDDKAIIVHSNDIVVP